MTINVYTIHSEVHAYLPKVQAAADENKKALGFLPKSAYHDNALKGRLWIAASTDTYLGHLLFGGGFPQLKVTQLFVDPRARCQGIGTRLIEELVSYGEKYGYLSVSARVAADLPANDFWEKMGFRCVRQVLGGRTTGRIINIRVRNLNVPHLFGNIETRIEQESAVASTATFSYQALPVIRDPTYALDINTLFDLIRHRERYDAIAAMVRAGFNHVVRLVLTSEASKELSRKGAAVEQSPALELVKALPVLPQVSDSDLAGYVEVLRSVVFPRRSLSRKDAAKDISDLKHLASCIFHRITGFVTSERAILRAAEEIKRQLAIDVVSPYEFLDPELDLDHGAMPVVARAGRAEVEIRNYQERDQRDVVEFLRPLGVSSEEASAALQTSTSGNPRRRRCAWVDEKLVAFASWTVPRRLRPEAQIYLYVDEEAAEAESVLEHLIEAVFREDVSTLVYGVRLVHGPGQSLTRRLAVQRGFRSRSNAPSPSESLYKLSVSGIVTRRSWTAFASAAQKLSGSVFRNAIPDFEEVSRFGADVAFPSQREPIKIGLFDLETMMSPGLFLFPGRSGVMIPIRERYAEDLLGGLSRQMSLLHSQEARLRIEKAYFRAPRALSLFTKGTPLVFYVSGHSDGAKQVVGIARVTSSAVLQEAGIPIQHYRQGVLDMGEISKIAAKNKGGVHVVTFDNVTFMKRPIAYGELKRLGCVGGANLVTAQGLPHDELVRLLQLGFSADKEDA